MGYLTTSILQRYIWNFVVAIAVIVSLIVAAVVAVVVAKGFNGAHDDAALPVLVVSQRI